MKTTTTLLCTLCDGNSTFIQAPSQNSIQTLTGYPAVDIYMYLDRIFCSWYIPGHPNLGWIPFQKKMINNLLEPYLCFLVSVFFFLWSNLVYIFCFGPRTIVEVVIVISPGWWELWPLKLDWITLSSKTVYCLGVVWGELTIACLLCTRQHRKITCTFGSILIRNNFIFYQCTFFSYFEDLCGNLWIIIWLLVILINFDSRY